MLLTGCYQRALDEKQRLALPRPLRDALGFPAATVVYLAPGIDGCLAIYPESSFARLADQLAGAWPMREDIRAFSRLFYARAQRVQLDRQGRIRIPVELCELAGLTKDVTLIGVRDHLELWDQRRWQEFLQQKSEQYDQVAESAFLHSALAKPPSGSELENVPSRPKQPR